MIALGADHAGFEYKEKIKELLISLGYEFIDFGTHSTESVDYPDYAHKVASGVSSGKFTTAILVCGTGIGMAITANKHAKVRAAVIESVEAAKFTRLHNNANILCLGSRLTTWERAIEIIKTFLSTDFEGGRHQQRVEKIHTLTNL
ncbi:MAG: ribose 5-phosphate isomerase B [Ignavibacteriales bacterium]|nr:ribose 5-phosphate isomerase B [Ignavibacteriales bacterium]